MYYSFIKAHRYNTFTWITAVRLNWKYSFLLKRIAIHSPLYSRKGLTYFFGFVICMWRIHFTPGSRKKVQGYNKGQVTATRNPNLHVDRARFLVHLECSSRHERKAQGVPVVRWHYPLAPVLSSTLYGKFRRKWLPGLQPTFDWKSMSYIFW